MLQVVLYLFLTLLLTLLLMVIWVLVTPIVVTINSPDEQYEVALKGIGKVNLAIRNEKVVAKMKLFFFQKEMSFNPFNMKETNQKTAQKRKKKGMEKQEVKRQGRRKSKTRYMAKVLAIIKSFEVKRLWLNIDTDDYYQNSLLYPIFYFIKGKNYQFNINYQGITEVVLVIKNRPIRILYNLIFK